MNSSVNIKGKEHARLVADSLSWFWIASFVVSIITIVGNSIVILLIALFARLRTRQNALILSLAVADLSIGLFVTPTMFACGAWITCEHTLQIVFYNFLLLSSTGNLLAMTFDRYIAVIYPFKYQRIMTVKMVVLLIALAWAIPFTASFIRLTWRYSNPSNLSHIENSYMLVMDIVFGIAPCVGLLLTYARIFMVVRKHRIQNSHQMNEVRYNNNNVTVSQPFPTPITGRTRRVKSVESLGGVIVVFVVCYCLNVSVSFCLNLRLCTVDIYVNEISLLLVMLNSAINFLVYSILKGDFRRELLRIFRKLNQIRAIQ